jgi:Na+/melibiose symporter-like transporter
MMSLLPAVAALLACAAMAFYTLDEPRMRSIGDDLRRRHAG